MVNAKGYDSQTIQCPACKAEAIYKYGHIRTGKQRYLCMMCGRQFTLGVRRVLMQERPRCPECGRPMHVYKQDNNILRFRCSGYPVCKSYTKISLTKEVKHESLHA